MRTLRASLIVTATIVACNSSLSPDRTDPVPSHGVLMTATDRGTNSIGKVMLVHLVNSGAVSAFLPRYGAGPNMAAETFVNGSWGRLPIGILCAQGPPGPVEILSGDSLLLNRTFSEVGRYRMAVGIGNKSDLSDATLATSNSFAVP